MSTATLEFNDARDPASGAADDRYFAVNIATLIGLPELPFNLYVQPTATSPKLLYRGADTSLPLTADDKLRQRNLRQLFLREKDRGAYQQAIQTALAQPPADLSIHLALTIEQHRDAFQAALAKHSVAPAVVASEKIAHSVLAVICHDDFTLGKVIDLLQHDRCTFQHSCNVGIYAAALAKRTGLIGDELRCLTTGGLLHDIGKRWIPSCILRKPGKLTEHEWKLVREHPTTGFRELAALGSLTWGQLMMAYQHHEWLDGRGYPVGVAGEEIHFWARIAAVADVFDALTAKRPYCELSYTCAALEIMAREVGHFDEELFKRWVEIVSS